MKRSLGALLAGGLVVGGSVPASACLNAVTSLDETVAAVQATERELDDGDPEAARDHISRVALNVAALEAKRGDVSPLRNRIARVGALATIRLDLDGSAEAMPTERLLPAVRALEELTLERPNDPGAETDLAEALARSRTHREEAKRILEGLAEHDVLTTSYGYAALARLRDAAGESAGRDSALERCLLMTRSASTCELHPRPRWIKRAVRVGTVGEIAAMLGALAGAMRRRRSATRSTRT